MQEDIHQAAGVLDTNCFEIKTKDKVRIIELQRLKVVLKALIMLINNISKCRLAQFGRSLFLTAAMFNNDCSPNCVRRVTRGNIEIISIR